MAKLVDRFYKDAHANVFNFSYSVLAILLLITVGITYVFYQNAHSKDVTSFKTDAERIQTAVENKIRVYITLLNSGRGFIESSSDINNTKFQAYAKSLEIARNYPGLRAIGYVKTIGPEGLDVVGEKMRSDGVPEFRVFPETGRETRQALLYVEPLDDLSRKGIGFDMASEPTRHEALRRAGETGEAAASGKVVPVISPEQSGTEPRIIIFLPVYGPEYIPGTPGNNGRYVQGYIYSAFIVENFINEINREVGNQNISVKVYDGEIGPENLLAESNLQQETGFVSFPNESYSYRSTFPIAGRNWVIDYGSHSSFTSQSTLGLTPLIFLGGVCISFLLFGMTYWEASARVKLQNTAAELFETQKQKEKLFEDEQRSRHAAEQANIAKDEFIAIISHELKTPLNAIAGWTRILRTHDISEATRDTALLKIDKNLRSQAGLVEQLLTYSDIISERIDLDNKQVNFGALVDETISEVSALAEEKGISLISQNSLNGEVVAGDRERLKIVLECILQNAVKFTQSGGKIESDLSKTGDVIQFTVTDNGRGIPTEFMPFIFDQYKQADNPNIRDYGGLGLGLTISKHILKLHNGSIEAQSDGKGRGSKFILQLPEKKTS